MLCNEDGGSKWDKDWEDRLFRSPEMRTMNSHCSMADLQGLGRSPSVEHSLANYSPWMNSIYLMFLYSLQARNGSWNFKWLKKIHNTRKCHGTQISRPIKCYQNSCMFNWLSVFCDLFHATTAELSSFHRVCEVFKTGSIYSLGSYRKSVWTLGIL